MDFYKICMREIEKGPRKGEFELYPDFVVGRSKDLMVRGRSFYAIWDEAAGLWSTDEYDVQRIVDQSLEAEAEKIYNQSGSRPAVRDLRSFGSNGWTQFRKFVQNISDNSHPLDENLTFANTEVKKGDYVSRRLPYSLEAGDYSAWDELIGTLYNTEERAKIEWSIGSIVSGDAKRIQKFLVLYGPAGTGKSTILNIIQDMFSGYVTTFEAKALGMNSGAFATEVFKDNPLVAIQHDGDLSKIEDNTRLNSIISHEEMTMNEKYKPSYTARVNAFLYMGTNQPVKISDAKSGIIRRLIDVHPTGVKIPPNRYSVLMSQIGFELGAIAHHCLEVYRDMGKNYYNSYRPLEMMFQTDVFFNFIEAYYDIFKEQDGATLKQAYALYKDYCAETGIDRVLPQYKVREELRNYFDEFHDRGELNGTLVRSLYTGFSANQFKVPLKDEVAFSLVMDETESLLDSYLEDSPAQYSKTTPDGSDIPIRYWSDEERLIEGVLKKPKKSQVVDTTLSDLDTKELHFVKPPENLIMIDFDLTDEAGNKSAERNLQAASSWPPTYAEYSKSGGGVHLIYIYNGDVKELATHYSEGIEVKTFSGNASMRRKLSKCNNIPIATISSGLPLKEKKMIDDQTIKSEKALRALIARNLRKEIHPGTKPSIDFIHKILEDAYSSGLRYDVTDMRGNIVAFANNSSNQSLTALKIVQSMKFKSEDVPDKGLEEPEVTPDKPYVQEKHENDDRIVYFDLEVYPNLFVVCWKFAGSEEVVRMINPKPQDIEMILRFRLVGFYNRRYDNHILYAAYMGYDNEALYKLSLKLVNNEAHATFGEAYNLSYTDIYDYASVKQSLKKWQIDLGIRHVEMEIPWDQPVPEELWESVVEYCCNDVISTEAVANARSQDFVARQILADLSGLPVNSTTNSHTAQIIFGKNKRPQGSHIYTDLSEMFPGYEYNQKDKLSTYRGDVVGEGGYVYAEPGIYENVALLDVASMHPTSIENLNLFGDEYTPRFADLKAARVAIKRGDYDSAAEMLDGKLAAHLGNPADAKALSDALKIVINSVYGLTSAKYTNPFRDPRNVDNIVAKRGALFMIDLKNAVQEKGFTVAHIKTDSIKIPNATQEIIDFVFQFGEKYGYEFEHEETYEKMALVNNAVYVAKYGGKWHATGAEFQHPYVFKKLFDPESQITFDDLCETKSVNSGVMYLDLEYDRPMAVSPDGMTFVGRFGRFVPVKEGYSGGILYRVKDGKNFAVTGTKGYLWAESHIAESFGPDAIDMDYFEKLTDDAVKTIQKFGDFHELVG